MHIVSESEFLRQSWVKEANLNENGIQQMLGMIGMNRDACEGIMVLRNTTSAQSSSPINLLWMVQPTYTQLPQPDILSVAIRLMRSW